MSTRLTLLRSARQRIQRDQIGTLVSPIAQRYLDAERNMLLRVAEAARESHKLQIALNAVIRAQSLESQANAAITQALSAVLWSLEEQKIAIQSLRQLVLPEGSTQTQTESSVPQALVLARLVSYTHFYHIALNTNACCRRVNGWRRHA
jgi:serine-protein kinase ATM